MAIKRIVSTEFWTDKKIVDQFSPEDKLFFLYLLTNPHTTQLGIYPFVTKIAAFEIGYSPESVSALIERFEKYGIIKFSQKTNEIAVKNYLKHSIVKGGTPVYDLLIKEAGLVKDKSLLTFVLSANGDNLNETVRKFVLSFYNDDDNDNDNDDSVPNRTRIVAESSKRFKKPTIEEVFAYCKERGNSVNPQSFIDWYESKGWRVGNSPMKDWKAAVRTWEQRDAEKKHAQPKPRVFKQGSADYE